VRGLGRLSQQIEFALEKKKKGPRGHAVLGGICSSIRGAAIFGQLIAVFSNAIIWGGQATKLLRDSDWWGRNAGDLAAEGRLAAPF